MRRTLLLFITFAAIAAISAPSALAQGDFIQSIAKAPVAPNGNVAGAATDFIVNFAFDKDPSAPGMSFAAGDQITLSLPASFKYVDPVNFPINRALTPACGAPPTGLVCTTAVLLRGWPQSPIPVDISHDAATNTFTFVITEPVVDNPPTAPGAKVLHLVGLGFQNPDPGNYPVRISITRNGSTETDTGVLKIKPKIQPSARITSVFNPPPPFPNTIYQWVSAGEDPLPVDYYVWNKRGGPMLGVELQMESALKGRLVKGDKVLGKVSVKPPTSASGASLTSPGPTTQVTAFITGVPAGRLTLQLSPGTQPGLYVVTLKMKDGNKVKTFVTVS